jgi:hypothetical protein
MPVTTDIIRIANANEDLGNSIPAGSILFNEAKREFFKMLNSSVSGDTISKLMALGKVLPFNKYFGTFKDAADLKSSATTFTEGSYAFIYDPAHPNIAMSLAAWNKDALPNGAWETLASSSGQPILDAYTKVEMDALLHHADSGLQNALQGLDTKLNNGLSQAGVAVQANAAEIAKLNPKVADLETTRLKTDGSIRMDSGYIAVSAKDLATVDTVRYFLRTVVYDLGDFDAPTLAECVATAKKIQHFNWTQDSRYFVKNTAGNTVTMIMYMAIPAATETNHGYFFHLLLNAIT